MMGFEGYAVSAPPMRHYAASRYSTTRRASTSSAGPSKARKMRATRLVEALVELLLLPPVGETAGKIWRWGTPVSAC
jgi:hypothetical protein